MAKSFGRLNKTTKKILILGLTGLTIHSCVNGFLIEKEREERFARYKVEEAENKIKAEAFINDEVFFKKAQALEKAFNRVQTVSDRDYFYGKTDEIPRPVSTSQLFNQEIGAMCREHGYVEKMLIDYPTMTWDHYTYFSTTREYPFEMMYMNFLVAKCQYWMENTTGKFLEKFSDAVAEAGKKAGLTGLPHNGKVSNMSYPYVPRNYPSYLNRRQGRE